jgi:hypothetical protein
MGGPLGTDVDFEYGALERRYDVDVASPSWAIRRTEACVPFDKGQQKRSIVGLMVVTIARDSELSWRRCLGFRDRRELAAVASELLGTI